MKVVSVNIKGKLVTVKGENNTDLAESLTQFSRGHWSPYMVKKSCDELEVEPHFTKDHAKGVWDENQTKVI